MSVSVSVSVSVCVVLRPSFVPLGVRDRTSLMSVITGFTIPASGGLIIESCSGPAALVKLSFLFWILGGRLERPNSEMTEIHRWQMYRQWLRQNHRLVWGWEEGGKRTAISAEMNTVLKAAQRGRVEKRKTSNWKADNAVKGMGYDSDYS